jgi:hypothetical protein
MNKCTTFPRACAWSLAALQGLACAQVPAEAPAEGALWRELFGDSLEKDYGVKIHGVAQVGFSSNTATTHERARSGNSNFPVVGPNDEGLQFNKVGLLIERPFKSNVLPRITPLPGPVPQDFSWGFAVEMVYGPSALPAMGYGFENDWGINRKPAGVVPGTQRESYLAMPHVMAQLYFPVAYGVALTVGRFGSGVGFEIPTVWRPSPNFFYSRTYALVAQPDLVFGGLLSANLMRSEAGLLAGELGVVNGRQNVRDNNGSKSVIAALRWRTPDMRTGVSYAMMTGNEENAPDHEVQMPTARILSPRGQRRTHHSLTFMQAVSAQTHIAVELVSGRQAGDGQADTIDIIGGPGFSGAKCNGLNAHLDWRATPQLQYGLRAETFDDKNGFALFPVSMAATRFNAVTAGVRYDFNKFVTLRPEIRHDWQSSQGANAFGGGRKRQQSTFSVDAVVNF